MKRKMVPVYRMGDVPHFASDDDAAAFWETHEVTEQYLADGRARGRVLEQPADILARARTGAG